MTITTKNMFGVFDISYLNLIVGHLNGTLAKIKYVGNLQLSKDVVLYDVLVVPEYCDLIQNKIVGTGSKSGGLYMFDQSSSHNIGSPGCGVQVNKTENFGVKVYTDSDWARCPITRKSVSGFCVFLGDSLVSWKSKKQATLSRSSTEAEYRCMASATCEIIWICNVLSEFGIKNVFPVEMFSDNISALQLAANLVFHEKSKHFEIDLQLIREKVSEGVVKTFKVHTTQQIADIFTKGLDIKQHQELCNKLNLKDMVDLQGCFVKSGDLELFVDLSLKSGLLLILGGSSEDKISSLDLGNPLHLQNSDFNSATIISVKLTGTENYRVWAAAMKLAISTRNKTGFLDGTCLKFAYASSASLSNKWDRCNYIVLSKKYGLEKVVNYSNLSSGNYCFSTSLNKSAEPSTFYEAIKDRNWIDAMNAEIEALNNT
ncbi:ribonuclease H-like domain-containing protein [Tanacetum coccineum]